MQKQNDPYIQELKDFYDIINYEERCDSELKIFNTSGCNKLKKQ